MKIESFTVRITVYAKLDCGCTSRLVVRPNGEIASTAVTSISKDCGAFGLHTEVDVEYDCRGLMAALKNKAAEQRWEDDPLAMIEGGPACIEEYQAEKAKEDERNAQERTPEGLEFINPRR